MSDEEEFGGGEQFEHGFGSPLWMARAILYMAPQHRLLAAVDEVLKRIWEADDEDFDGFELFDVFVQIATTGIYTPLELSQEYIDEVHAMSEEAREKEIDRRVAEFMEEVDKRGFTDEADT